MADNIHASLVALGPAGVLILGQAGSGKSSLALCLVRAGRREGLDCALVADDRVVLEREAGVLVGRAPATIAGLAEIRGLGVLRLPVATEARIALAAELVEAPERMPEARHLALAGVEVPRIRLPLRQAPFAADLILSVLLAGELAPGKA